MTTLATLYGSVTITEDATPMLTGSVEVTGATFWIELTVTNEAAVAFAQRFQAYGFRVDVDRGDGVMVTIPDREVGRVLSIRESAEEYGDTLAFRLDGERFSPYSRSLLVSKAKVQIYETHGAPGAEWTKLIFTGWILRSGYDMQPPTSEVVCLDAAALYQEKRAPDWSLPPNSGRSRLSITTELLGIGGIPIKALDLANGNGGIVNKPHTLGDRTILEFLTDFLLVIGCEIGFEDGAFVARRWDPDAPPVAELYPGNLSLPDSIQSPQTLDPNVITVVATRFESEDPSGYRTVETSVITTGPYAPQRYEFLQVGEALIPNPAGAESPTIRTISEVVTRVTYFGDLDVRTEETTRSWYAVRAAGQRIGPIVGEPGYEVVPVAENVYIFPDGSTRGDPVEQFRVTSKTIRTKDLDDDYNVVATREEKYFFHFLRAAPWLVVAGVDEFQPLSYQPVNDEGQVLVTSREVMGLVTGGGSMEGGAPQSSLYTQPDELIETEVTLNDDGSIREEVITEHAYSIGAARRRSNGAWGYGIEERTYTNRPAEAYSGASDPWGGLKITTRRYRAVDEDRYVLTEIVKAGLEPPVTKTSTFIGAIPRPERAGPTTSSQEIRATVDDTLRITLAGGDRILRVEHNEFLENETEAASFARYLARRAAARVISLTMPMETLIHKFRNITLSVPGASIEDLVCYVRTVERDGATLRQSVTVEHYPATWA